MRLWSRFAILTTCFSVFIGCSKGGELILEPDAVVTPPGSLQEVDYIKATNGGGIIYEVGPPAGSGYKARISINPVEQKVIQDGSYTVLLSRVGG